MRTLSEEWKCMKSEKSMSIIASGLCCIICTRGHKRSATSETSISPQPVRCSDWNNVRGTSISNRWSQQVYSVHVCVCQALICNKTLSVKIMRPLSVKALICRNICGSYLQKPLSVKMTGTLSSLSRYWCCSRSFKPIFTKLGGNVATWIKLIYGVEKHLVARIQHGGCRHLEFRKTDAVLSIFDQISPNLVWMLRL